MKTYSITRLASALGIDRAILSNWKRRKFIASDVRGLRDRYSEGAALHISIINALVKTGMSISGAVKWAAIIPLTATKPVCVTLFTKEGEEYGFIFVNVSHYRKALSVA